MILEVVLCLCRLLSAGQGPHLHSKPQLALLKSSICCQEQLHLLVQKPRWSGVMQLYAPGLIVSCTSLAQRQQVLLEHDVW